MKSLYFLSVTISCTCEHPVLITLEQYKYSPWFWTDEIGKKLYLSCQELMFVLLQSTPSCRMPWLLVNYCAIRDKVQIFSHQFHRNFKFKAEKPRSGNVMKIAYFLTAFMTDFIHCVLSPSGHIITSNHNSILWIEAHFE